MIAKAAALFVGLASSSRTVQPSRTIWKRASLLSPEPRVFAQRSTGPTSSDDDGTSSILRFFQTALEPPNMDLTTVL